MKTTTAESIDKKVFILDISEKLFARYGARETTVRLITQKAGISIAMLNYYFGSKENLFLTVLERRIQQFKTAKNAVNMDNKGTIEMLLTYMTVYIDLVVDYQPFYKLMMIEKLLNENKKAVEMIESYFQSNIQTLKNIIIQSVDDEKIDGVNIETFVMNISGFLAYLILQTDLTESSLKEEKKQNLKKHIMKVLLASFFEM
ncbi:transcriptional regulator, TetR family [Flavobacterium resistens]|uniref:TetR family transcriptional regulator n=1 Tax=Flavobacterium resistens TaxID=443612 RepID=A0A521AUA0_9FLAO|nr:TetR/AcrR family transcriptional regulator [Flavobacterium resistens]MRX68580.1 TetR family transcriptional regulator [Flavobacterium resistens]SMO38387.1 transcriptional regulator, TetR family [Flavobacterium resistens]